VTSLSRICKFNPTYAAAPKSCAEADRPYSHYLNVKLGHRRVRVRFLRKHTLSDFFFVRTLYVVLSPKNIWGDCSLTDPPFYY